MLTAVNGYYDGKHIVTEENIRLVTGQKVIITILDSIHSEKKNDN